MAKRYEITGMIGEGGFGKVYLAQRRSDGIQVAIKIVDKPAGQVVPKEVLVLEALKGVPGVVQILEHADNKDSYAIITEYCKGVDLFDYMSRETQLSFDAATALIKQILAIIVEMRKRGVYHNDIKDTNIMMSPEGVPTIIDFGAASFDQDKVTEDTYGGTPVYSPPEWLNSNVFDPDKACVWSIGNLFYTLVFGANPFRTVKEVNDKRITTAYPIINNCLLKHVDDRYSLDELCDLLAVDLCRLCVDFV